ncbi:hypothetical protein V8C86DRAFT_3120844 [Haematococcus lacustris]
MKDRMEDGMQHMAHVTDSVKEVLEARVTSVQENLREKRATHPSPIHSPPTPHQAQTSPPPPSSPSPSHANHPQRSQQDQQQQQQQQEALRMQQQQQAAWERQQLRDAQAARTRLTSASPLSDGVMRFSSLPPAAATQAALRAHQVQASREAANASISTGSREAAAEVVGQVRASVWGVKGGIPVEGTQPEGSHAWSEHPPAAAPPPAPPPPGPLTSALLGKPPPTAAAALGPECTPGSLLRGHSSGSYPTLPHTFGDAGAAQGQGSSLGGGGARQGGSPSWAHASMGAPGWGSGAGSEQGQGWGSPPPGGAAAGPEGAGGQGQGPGGGGSGPGGRGRTSSDVSGLSSTAPGSPRPPRPVPWAVAVAALHASKGPGQQQVDEQQQGAMQQQACRAAEGVAYSGAGGGPEVRASSGEEGGEGAEVGRGGVHLDRASPARLVAARQVPAGGGGGVFPRGQGSGEKGQGGEAGLRGESERRVQQQQQQQQPPPPGQDQGQGQGLQGPLKPQGQGLGQGSGEGQGPGSVPVEGREGTPPQLPRQGQWQELDRHGNGGVGSLAEGGQLEPLESSGWQLNQEQQQQQQGGQVGAQGHEQRTPDVGAGGEEEGETQLPPPPALYVSAPPPHPDLQLPPSRPPSATFQPPSSTASPRTQPPAPTHATPAAHSPLAAAAVGLAAAPEQLPPGKGPKGLRAAAMKSALDRAINWRPGKAKEGAGERAGAGAPLGGRQGSGGGLLGGPRGGPGGPGDGGLGEGGVDSLEGEGSTAEGEGSLATTSHMSLLSHGSEVGKGGSSGPGLGRGGKGAASLEPDPYEMLLLIPKLRLPSTLGLPVRTRSARGGSVPGRLLCPPLHSTSSAAAAAALANPGNSSSSSTPPGTPLTSSSSSIPGVVSGLGVTAGVRMVQSVTAHDGVIWVMRLSKDGHMVATGGQDGLVKVWRLTQAHAPPAAAEQPRRVQPAQPVPTSSYDSQLLQPPRPPQPPASPLDQQQLPGLASYTSLPAPTSHTSSDMSVTQSVTEAMGLGGAPVSGSQQGQGQGQGGGGGQGQGQGQSHVLQGPPHLYRHSDSSTRLPPSPPNLPPASPSADPSSLLLDGRGEEGACVGLLWGGRPVLQPQPLAVLGGHQEAVLDLSWSPASTLLLTASADNTVQLWPLQPGPLTPHRAAGGAGAGAGSGCVQEQLICLQEYPHPDIVTCVAWHPLDSRLFVTGCGDGRALTAPRSAAAAAAAVMSIMVGDWAGGCRLRVWSAGDCLVLATASLPHDLLTACDWAHDGSSVVAGTLHGKCKYFGWTASPSRNIAEQQHEAGLQPGTAPQFGNAGSTPHLPGLTVKQLTQTAPKACAVSGALTSGRLEYAATVDVRDRRRAAGPGSKVTSVVALPGQHESFLVASNDSRIRRYTRYALEVKYKGLRSTNTMVRVSVTSDGKHLVSGADNGWVHVWDTSLYEPEPAASASLQQGKGAYRAVQKLRSKNGFCDSFATEEQCVTCAMVAPPASWRLNRAQAQRRLIEVLNAAGGTTSSASSRLSDKRGLQSAKRAPGEEEEAPRASDTTLNALAATLNSALLGAAFLVGGFSGRLLVYENV